MGLPSVIVNFKEAARTAPIRSQRGVVGLIIRESIIPNENPFTITSEDDIPAGLSAANVKQIKLALMGYTEATNKLLLYLIPAIGTTTYSYSKATVDSGDNPSDEGWYEKDGSDYIPSEDVIADSGKTYYIKSTTYGQVTPVGSENPSEEGWYEKDASDNYFLTQDTEVDSEKEYYEASAQYDTVSSPDYGDNPTTEGWYEVVNGAYTASSDTRVDVSKTYYVRTSTSLTTPSIDQYTPALNYFVQKRVNYLAIPTVETEELTADVKAWVTSLHASEAENSPLVAVLPNTAGASEYIVNYVTESVTDEDGKSYTAEKYCARIAGILATTPLTMSCTYAILPELTGCTYHTKAELDAAIDAGKLVIFYDGEKCKIGRGVNSFVATTPTKSAIYKKIRVIDILCMIRADIARTAEDNYIGKYTNSYDNKMLLVGAINDYFAGLATQGALAQGGTCEIDVAANKQYLKDKGIDVSGMSDDDIRKANTDDKVFLAATISILDAMEDITLNITI